ncbi:MASE1 domain-containing protein [Azohydromonas aeria]|uniref:MASE1 domain-containing protein n=1 Tax=Azohydromonas aeria TaxID=2590212 RepID=UPI0012F87699|nr:MASE1 domain-containing protein [Azohydromonas aeria]
MKNKIADGATGATESGIAARIARLLAFAALYLLAAWGGQAFFIAPDQGVALWPPSGIFLAALLLIKRRDRPWLVALALCADFGASTVLFGFPPGIALTIAVGNALEATVGAFLLRRWAGGHFRIADTGSVLAFVLLSALASPLLSTVLGGTAISIHTGEPLLTSWKLWWTGDSAGVLIFTPLTLVLFGRRDDGDRPAAGRVEVLLMLCALLLVGHAVMSRPYPTMFMILPVLIWAALRGEHRAIALANAVVTLQVVLYTQFGHGPFAADYALHERQLLVQSFIMAATLTGLVLAGQACQRRRSTLDLDAARAAAERALAAAEAAQARAEHANRAKSQFLANMSHEFHTPLNAVIGLGHLLSKMDLPRKAGEYATHIQQAGNQLLALTTDVLDVSRMEAGALELEQVPFKPHVVLYEAVAFVRPQAEAKGLALRLDVAPALPATLLGDPTRLLQVLMNLLGNAVKFTRVGGVELRVHVVAQSMHQVTLRLDVVDTGSGIAPEQHERIFETFAQVDDSIGRLHGGTGLGLSIVRHLVGLMGGTLELQSMPGAGSTFSVTVMFELPVAPGAA